ncbi:MAG: flagellar biosynthetic protein FliR [Gammaproteobacteria bacterium]|nr:MAG: flagellar biosynthetic protein FliR [Pseudomonadota bacterium]PIE38094.1 MAG: flagellar biosynthetic protein FliR [Gammaproteobacteria bacterium]
MIEFAGGDITRWVAAHLWPLFRVASFLMAVPFVGARLVPMRIRLGLALLITLVILPSVAGGPDIDPLSLPSLYVIFQQVLIGVSLGFLVTLFTQMFVVAGQIMAMQMGLGFAAMMDPANGVSVPVLSQFFLVTVTLVFLSMNGHLLMIDVIVTSFHAWPISASMIDPGAVWAVIHRIVWLFSAALLIALPVSASVFIVNVSFGVMTRAAPQLNVFALGFPIAQIFGMVLVYVSLNGFLDNFILLLEDTFVFINRELLGV